MEKEENFALHEDWLQMKYPNRMSGDAKLIDWLQIHALRCQQL